MDTEVWVLYLKRDKPRIARSLDVLRRLCNAQDKKWTLQERHLRPVPRMGGGELVLVEPRDAWAIYRRMHRVRVSVLLVGACRVCTEPPEDRAIRRDLTIPFRQYCQYKSFATSTTFDDKQIAEWFGAFNRWLAEVHCINEHDPRCIPFPMFACNCEVVTKLHSQEGRAKFSQDHGKGNNRFDAIPFRWQLRPEAFHGDEILHVAGRQLPKGLHWDVQTETRKKLRLSSILERWTVRDYVNVFPDGQIRGKRPYAKQD